MAKGYWIAHVDVSDPEGYKEYQAANATALACYSSPEYAAAIEKRKDRSEIDLVIVEGYDGVQPV